MSEEAVALLRARLEGRLPQHAYGIECGDGWLMLLGELDHDIVKYDPGYSLAQVKAKFGTLRFYVDLSDDLASEARDAVYGLIREAERKSAVLCELCGATGTMRRGRWMRVRCDACEDTSN